MQAHAEALDKVVQWGAEEGRRAVAEAEEAAGRRAREAAGVAAAQLCVGGTWGHRWMCSQVSRSSP
jgi:hypothetical protein